MNLATLIDVTGRTGSLGAPEDVNLQAWETYIRNARNQMVLSWNEARAAYLTLKQVRESFGLPLIRPAGEAGGAYPNALFEEDNQVFLDTAAAVDLLTRVADEALAGTRQVAYDSDLGSLVIELQPTDTIRVVVVEGRPRLVDVGTGQPVPVGGTIGLAPLAWVAIAGVAALVTYFTTDTICTTIKDAAQQKTMSTALEEQAKLVAGGKASPEQAKKMTAAVFAGAKDLEVAKGAAKRAEGESGIQSTVRTVMWVALGVAVLFFGSRVIPPLLESRQQERALPA